MGFPSGPNNPGVPGTSAGQASAKGGAGTGTGAVSGIGSAGEGAGASITEPVRAKLRQQTDIADARPPEPGPAANVAIAQPAGGAATPEGRRALLSGGANGFEKRQPTGLG